MKAKKLTALILSLLMLAVPLASCTQNDSTDETDPSGETVKTVDGDTIEKQQLLTHIFRGTKLALPEGYNIRDGITPLYDEETGNVTCFCSYSTEVPSADDPTVMEYVNEQHIVTVAQDGTLIEDRKLDLGDYEGSVNDGIFFGDYFYFLESNYDRETFEQTYYLVKYNLTDNTLVKSESLQPLFTESEGGRSWFYISHMNVDNDGFIYLASDQEILVLDGNFIKSFSVFSTSWFDGLTLSPDGIVYTYGYFDTGRGLCPIDKATKSLGAPIEYEGSSSLREIYFGKGYDMYFTDDEGLYGLNLTDGSYEPVMNFQNSDVTDDSITIQKIIDNETFLATERDPQTYRYSLSLFKKADDLDLSTVKVIEIATASGSDYSFPAQLVEFNKANPDVRVVLTDYSQYNTDEDYTAGMTKLTMDIMNGLYQPDIVLGDATSDVMQQMIASEQYVDLYTFIDKDDKIKRDDLLGGFTRTYSDGDKLWGITASFTVSTLIAPKSMIGDRESWTFTEMLDFATALPEDVALVERMSQETVANTIFQSTGYGAFIDTETNTAHFDSPEFIKYLEYIAKLPATFDSSTLPEDYYDTRYLNYHNGKIALQHVTLMDTFDYVRSEATFNTKDFTFIGYPTANEGEYGSYAESNYSFMITSFSEYPEEAWSFLREIIAPSTASRYYDRHFGFPILRSKCEEACREYLQFEYNLDIDGSGGGYGTYDPEHPAKAEDYNEPVIITYFTEDDLAALMDILDNKVGAPVVSTVSEDIQKIVEEEISSFTAGTRDAKATADIIQSRVSIWLAEHE